MKVNLNDRVRVVLTEKGLEVYRKHFIDLQEKHKTGLWSESTKRTNPVLEIQLWVLIEMFGPAMYMSAPQVFKTNEIEMLPKK